jgi:putative IMPACT (imprinted ancient) family translation regulator
MFRPTTISVFKFRERASVFLTELHPASNAEERQTIHAKLRKRDFDATHQCSVWREGVPVKAFGADDDGEPSGTAGAPMLRVLEGADLTDCLVVCLRWFGGTKLGTGGLVRAYTEGVQGVIAEARISDGLEPVHVFRHGSMLAAPEQAHLPFALLGAFPEAEVLGQDFAPEGTRVRFRIPPGQEQAVERAWQERSRGGTVIWDQS